MLQRLYVFLIFLLKNVAVIRIFSKYKVMVYRTMTVLTNPLLERNLLRL